METIKFIVFLLGTFIMLVTLREFCDVYIWEKKPNITAGVLYFGLIALSYCAFLGLLVGIVTVQAI